MDGLGLLMDAKRWHIEKLYHWCGPWHIKKLNHWRRSRVWIPVVHHTVQCITSIIHLHHAMDGHAVHHEHRRGSMRMDHSRIACHFLLLDIPVAFGVQNATIFFPAWLVQILKEKTYLSSVACHLCPPHNKNKNQSMIHERLIIFLNKLSTWYQNYMDWRKNFHWKWWLKVSFKT